MKGVSMLRVTLRPHAYCVGADPDGRAACGFEWWGAESRSTARQHARDTGHEVFVDVIDRTSYSREVTT